MAIYFAAAIRAGRDDEPIYRRIVERLREFGQVHSEYAMATGRPGSSRRRGDRAIHDRDLQWLRGSDFLVAEVTTPSLGVGYEIGKATEWGIPVLALFRPDAGRSLSAMIAGGADIMVREYSGIDELDDLFGEFFLGLGREARRAGAPPPVIALDAQVIEYARLGDGVTFTGRLDLSIDGKPVGALPGLAIARALDDSGALFLFHCDKDWSVVATSDILNLSDAEAGTAADLRAIAERYYSGSSSRWVPHPVPEPAAREYAKRIYRRARCSHCNRGALEIKSMVRGDRANICNFCLERLWRVAGLTSRPSSLE